MKILSIEQVRRADQYTIENEPISSVDLMERAGGSLTEWLYDKINSDAKVYIFCGKGNNGGDGLVIARLLAERGIVSSVYIVHHTQHFSSDCDVNFRRLMEQGLVDISFINSEDDFPDVKERESVVVDALFGSGLSRPLSGVIRHLVEHLNKTIGIHVSVDLPTGLYADMPLHYDDVVFRADYTLTFQFPKLAFFFPENEGYVGSWHVLDIGLSKRFIDTEPAFNFMTTDDMVKPLLRRRYKFAHKGTFGHALLVAGSSTMTGAAILSARACLRSGVGLLTVHLPQRAALPLQVSLPEAMVDYDVSEDILTDVRRLERYDAVAVGPGLGRDAATAEALKRIIQEVRQPLVLDADALNILAENKTWLPFLPPKTILTPHPKEFERLVGPWTNSFERLERQRELAMKNNIVVVLKGAYTSVMMPNGACFFNTTGNAGMATAGSGDVLTGIIVALLAQRYTPEEAAVLGVFLHGTAGDLAAETYGMESMLSGDIIEKMGMAFSKLR